MKMILNKLTISNFKGASAQEITFKNRTTISGANGTGKTTIMDAFMWLLAGKDSTLTDNPNIVPIGLNEANPTVSADFDIDGKPVSVRKVQTYKNKDGKESTSNQYFVNDVPMTERDFKAKMETYGVDFDKMLVLSHPDYLLRDTSKKGRDFVRNDVLFPMAQTVSDKDIAKKEKLKELAKALDDYELLEIEKMQKATLSRIDKEIGKNNVVANARIDELSRQKVTVSKETKDRHKALTEQLADLEAKKKRADELQMDIMNLKFDRSAVVSALNEEICRQKSEVDKTLAETMKMANQANNEVELLNNKIEVKQESISSNESRIKYLKDKQAELKKRKFDKKQTVCPTCGQDYPADMAKEIEDRFNSEKEAQMESIKAEMSELEHFINEKKEEIANLFADRDEQIDKAKKLKSECKELQKAYDSLKTNSNEESDCYKSFMKQITDREKEIEKIGNVDGAITDINRELVTINMELLKEKANADIDKRIEEIRSEIKQAEINRANAEKLLYQIECLNKAKNAMLEESINKHFKLVKWKLFRTLKNGSMEDSCTPIVDGFSLDGQANKARCTLAKLDIIAGLSKFYGQHYPVFLDNAESTSADTRNRFDFDGQLIELFVTEDKELNIKED